LLYSLETGAARLTGREESILSRSRIIVALCALAVVAVVVAGLAARGVAKPLIGLGQPLDVPGLRVVVDDVRVASAIDLGDTTVRPDGRFAILRLTLTNTAAHAVKVPDEVFRLDDGTGVVYRPAGVTNRLRVGTAWGVTLAAGETRPLLVVFDIRTAAEPRWLEVAAPPADPLDLPTGQRFEAAGRVGLR
jgi:Domain of unknown function (DUF4352)